MPFVYILRTGSGKYYIGSAIDLDNRIKHHSGGHTPSTKRMGTVKLIFSQKYGSLEEARGVELRLKKLKRKDYIEKIIKDGVII